MYLYTHTHAHTGCVRREPAAEAYTYIHTRAHTHTRTGCVRREPAAEAPHAHHDRGLEFVASVDAVYSGAGERR